LSRTVGAAPLPFTETARVDAKDNITSADKGGTGGNRSGIRSQEFILSNVILATMPVAVKNGRELG
jgi:hypothetical protein